MSTANVDSMHPSKLLMENSTPFIDGMQSLSSVRCTEAIQLQHTSKLGRELESTISRDPTQQVRAGPSDQKTYKF